MIDVNLIGSPAFAVRVTADGFVYIGMNARLYEISGLSAADVVGRSPHACLPPDVAEAVTARYRACVASRQPAESEVAYKGPNGTRWWHVTVTPVFDATGAVASLVGVSTDITDRRAAERDERDAEARMALAMDVLDGGFWHLDLATGTLDASPKLARLMTGSPTERMDWPRFVALIHPDDRGAFDAAARRAGGSEAATVEVRVRTAAAGERWLRSKCRAIGTAGGAPARVVGVVTDVTDLKRVEALYAREAVTDALTGLANRRGFEASAGRFAEAAARRGSRFGLVVVDLDGFKPVNDRHGHATGDVVLRDLAARLAAAVRPCDVVARIGGDEFAILVADVADGDLPALAERLLAAARTPFATATGEVAVGLSLGLATSRPGDGATADLAARADAALYAVKSAGRGAWRMAA